MVEERALPDIIFDAICARDGVRNFRRDAVETPREVERRVADACIAPVDYPDHAAVLAEDVLGPEVGMEKYGHEIELWNACEDGLGSLALARPEQREGAPPTARPRACAGSGRSTPPSRSSTRLSQPSSTIRTSWNSSAGKRVWRRSSASTLKRIVPRPAFIAATVVANRQAAL